MSSFATIVINDGLATPVAHTFNPQRIDSNGVATFLGNQSVYNAKEILTLSGQLPAKGASRAIVRVRLALPVMDSVDTTKKIDEALFVGGWYIPTRTDVVLRKNLQVMTSNFVLHAAMTDAIQQLTWQY